MNKILYLLITFFGLSTLVSGQDFKPGQQAQGMLESKNVTVDHATGMFHYRIPLYTLKSGGYELPISLNYTASGVRTEDLPGITGYNWTLNCGGVVTRTVRGGIADEGSDGFLDAARKNLPPLTNDTTSINKHERDGECDLFTAVFNGQQINFFIRLGTDYKIYAVPLERTNVKIECESSEWGRTINGWTITDEQGNRYIYRQKEWTANICSEGSISMNGIHNQSYISSWYLNRIEPQNGEPIVFHYQEDVQVNGEQEYINASKYGFSCTTQYQYGRPLQEYDMDFSKYRNGYQQNIEAAREFIQAQNILDQVNTQYAFFIDSIGWVRNPGFDIQVERINTNFQIMGLLVDYSKIGKVSAELIYSLNQVIDYYSMDSSPYAVMAVFHLEAAKQSVEACLSNVSNVTSKTSYSGTAYTTRSPILSHIQTPDKLIEIQYTEGQPKIMKALYVCDIAKNKLSGIKIDYNISRKITKVSFVDKEENCFQNFRFEYYQESPDTYLECDIWGYHVGANESETGYHTQTDPENVMVGSLKSIFLPQGGKINISYEPNKYGRYFPPIAELDAGGMRIKSLILEDNTSHSDTIRYRYPNPGCLIYSDMYLAENVNYKSGFSDYLIHSRVRYRGGALTKNGNNGVYYNFVIEEINGKGSNAYWFYIPSKYYFFEGDEYYRSFWLCGLPLGTASYDTQGNLKQITQNYYCTDLSKEEHIEDLYWANEMKFFEQSDSLTIYNESKVQVKVYDFYLDKDEVEKEYQEMEDILLYEENNHAFYFKPYEHQYKPNILPRINVILPKQDYTLYYGGKTLLKKQLVFMVEDKEGKGARYEDLFRTDLNEPFSQTEYRYDNLQYSTEPTRIITTDSKGMTQTTIVKRVSEMDNSAGEFIQQMKAKNMLSPVIKQIILKDSTLLNETVNIYTPIETDSTTCLVPTKQYVYYAPSMMVSFNMDFPDNRLFTYEEEQYIQEKDFLYKSGRYTCTVNNSDNRTSKVVTVYDWGGNHKILEAKGNGGDALDLKKYKGYKNLLNQINGYDRLCKSTERFYQLYQSLEQAELPEEFVEYKNTDQHQTIIKVISAIATQGMYTDLDSIHSLRNELISYQENIAAEFFNKYLQLSYSNPELGFDYDVISDVTFIFGNQLNDNLFKYKYFTDYSYLFRNNNLVINEICDKKKVNIYVLPDSSYLDENITCHLTCGEQSKDLTFPVNNDMKIQIISIDLSEYDGDVSVTVSRPSYQIYVAIIPEGTEFEATSYNPDGTIYAKFNQTGEAEFYEYDPAGRVIRITDQNGHTRKEYEYHTVTNNE